MKRLSRIVIAAALLLVSRSAFAQVDTVYVSRLFTTHLVFPTEIKYGDLSNTDQIAASVVEYSKNLLSIIAYEPFTQPANVTVLESNGNIHTYILVYREHPSELVIDTRLKRDGSASAAQSSENAQAKKKYTKVGATGGEYVNSLWKQDAPPLKDVISYPQGIFHIAKKVGRVKVVCENIFSYSDITYFVLSLENRSGVSFEVGDATFRIEPRSRKQRKLVAAQNLIPQNKVGSLTAAPKETGRVAYALDKITLSEDQNLIISVFEKGGQRNFDLVLSSSDVNLATPPGEK